MPELIPVLSKEKINQMVSDVAKRISSNYKGRDLVLIGVLKGAFVFLSDLLRHITIPVKVDFIQISSYGAATNSSEKIRLTKGVEIDLKNMDVLIVEDIVDTGLSIKFIKDYLASLDPLSIKVCSLLDKMERRKEHCTIDYVCCSVEEGFLVGYGLDYAEKYRNLPEIYHLKL